MSLCEKVGQLNVHRLELLANCGARMPCSFTRIIACRRFLCATRGVRGRASAGPLLFLGRTKWRKISNDIFQSFIEDQVKGYSPAIESVEVRLTSTRLATVSRASVGCRMCASASWCAAATAQAEIAFNLEKDNVGVIIMGEIRARSTRVTKCARSVVLPRCHGHRRASAAPRCERAR
jgi:hypothetical protein